MGKYILFFLLGIIVTSVAIYIVEDTKEVKEVREVKEAKRTTGLCHEVIIKDVEFLNDVATYYYRKDELWGERKIPKIYLCPLEMIQKIDQEAEALYMEVQTPGDGTILINDAAGFMDDDEYAWSMLVHELVHYLQDLDGKLKSTDDGTLLRCEIENEAYNIQRRWINETNSKWTVKETDECA